MERSSARRPSHASASASSELCRRNGRGGEQSARRGLEREKRDQVGSLRLEIQHERTSQPTKHIPVDCLQGSSRAKAGAWGT
eukprot:358456-Chlamydomonas_euryale.AAC.6